MAKQLTKKQMLEVLDAHILIQLKNEKRIEDTVHMTAEAKERRRRDASYAYIVLDFLRDEFMGVK